MLEIVYHVDGHYFKESNGTREEITVDQWLSYFNE
jgi:hypothetical protein